MFFNAFKVCKKWCRSNLDLVMFCPCFIVLFYSFCLGTRILATAWKTNPLKPHDDRYDGTRIGTKDSKPAGHLLIQ